MRTRRKPGEEAPPANQDDVIAAAAELEDTDDDLSRVLMELSPDVVQVRLSRIREDGQKAFIRTFSTANFNLDMVARTYKAGRYLAQFRRADGKLARPGNRTFLIDAEPEPETAAPAAASGMEGVVKELLAEIRALRTAPPAPVMTDPFAIAAKMTEASATNMETLVKLMGLLKPEAAAAPRSGGMKETVEAVEAVLALSERLGNGGGGGGGEGGVLGQVLAAVGPALGELVRKGLSTPAGQEVGPPPAAPPQTGPAAPPAQLPPAAPQQNPPGGGGGDLMQQLAPHVREFIRLAKGGSPPELYAGVIEDQHSEEVEQLRSHVAAGLLTRELIEEHFFKAFPDTLPHADWFRAVIAFLLDPDESDLEELPDTP